MSESEEGIARKAAPCPPSRGSGLQGASCNRRAGSVAWKGKVSISKPSSEHEALGRPVLEQNRGVSGGGTKYNPPEGKACRVRGIEQQQKIETSGKIARGDQAAAGPPLGGK